MERRAHGSAGWWQLSAWQLTGVLVLASALVVAPVVVLTTQRSSSSGARGPSASVPGAPTTTPQPPSPTAPPPVPPVEALAVADAVLPANARVVASSDTTLASDGIVVEVIDGEGPAAAGPTMTGDPTLDTFLSVVGSFIMRVRWTPAQGSVTDYQVVCDQVGPTPTPIVMLEAALAQGGNFPWQSHLVAVTTDTVAVFNNNQLPHIGSTYRCTVTPRGPDGVGVGSTVTATAIIPGLSLSLFGPARIAGIEQVDGALMVDVVEDDGSRIADAAVVAVRCTEVDDGTVLVGVGSMDDFGTVPPVPVHGGVIGHQYRCIAWPVLHEVTPAVVGPVVVDRSGDRLPAPSALVIDGAEFGALGLHIVVPDEIAGGTRIEVRGVCQRDGSADSVTLWRDLQVASPSPDWGYFFTQLTDLTPGTWTCSAWFRNEHGDGDAVTATAELTSAIMPAPTGLTFDRMDDANAILRVTLPARAWQTPYPVVFVAACRNVATFGVTMQEFPLEDLTDLGGGMTEVAVALDAGALYRCEHALGVRPDWGYVDGMFGVPYEFTTPAARTRGDVSLPPSPTPTTTTTTTIAPTTTTTSTVPVEPTTTTTTTTSTVPVEATTTTTTTMTVPFEPTTTVPVEPTTTTEPTEEPLPTT